MNSTEHHPDDPNGAAAHLSHDGSTVPAPRLARSVLLATMAGYSLVTAVNILDAGSSPLENGIGFLALLVIFGLQLVHSRPQARQSSYGCRVTTLALQAACCFLPLALFHLAWGAMCGFLAGSVLLLLPARTAWPLYVAIGLSLYGYSAFVVDRSLFDSVYTLETTLVTGLVVFGLSTLTRLVARLHAQRSDLARLAVAEERLRFSRDLHDLLGYNLSAITLKTELVRRLVPDMPAPARAETDSILALSRQSLADVRKVATGYRDMSLREEVAATRSMLEAAGIEVVATVGTGPLPPQIDTVLATVLREGVTNALRHSHVHRCAIRCAEEGGVVTLSIDNDGVEPVGRNPFGAAGPVPRQAADEPGGTGLGNLTHRLGRLGGSLTTELGDDGWFRMTARAPLGARPDTFDLNRMENAQK